MAVYNRVFSNEKWEKVNSYNKNLLKDYILQIKSEGKSDGSIKQYNNDARIVLIYILEELDNKPLYKLNRKSFRNFVLWMQDSGLSPARINRMLSTCRNLLNFGLDDDEYVDEFETCKANPARIKGVQKEKRREIVFLSHEQICIIYNKLMEEEKYCQALLCALMYESACRRKEAYQVKRSDISLDSKMCKRQVRGKRGKLYKPIYNEMTLNAFKKLEEKRINDDSDALWITQTGDAASYETLYAWVISWREILKDETGVSLNFNPHSWRHSAATNLKNGTHHYCLKSGGKKFELAQIQKLMNHSDISTTQSYLEDKTEEEILEAFGV